MRVRRTAPQDEPPGCHSWTATPGPTTQGYTERWAGNLLRLARARRGLSQRQLAEAAGVPMSTVARIKTAARQPSLITLSRLLAAADLELRIQIEDYDDVLDARRAMLTDAQREQVDAGSATNSAVVARARAEGIRLGVIPARPHDEEGRVSEVEQPPLDAVAIVEVLERHRVEYLVVGGYAAELHAKIRTDAEPAGLPFSTSTEALAGVTMLDLARCTGDWT